MFFINNKNNKNSFFLTLLYPIRTTIPTIEIIKSKLVYKIVEPSSEIISSSLLFSEDDES